MRVFYRGKFDLPAREKAFGGSGKASFWPCLRCELPGRTLGGLQGSMSIGLHRPRDAQEVRKHGLAADPEDWINPFGLRSADEGDNGADSDDDDDASVAATAGDDEQVSSFL